MVTGGCAGGAKQAAGFAGGSAFGAEQAAGFAIINIGGSAPNTPGSAPDTPGSTPEPPTATPTLTTTLSCDRSPWSSSPCSPAQAPRLRRILRADLRSP